MDKKLTIGIITLAVLTILVVAGLFLRGVSPRTDFETALVINGEKVSLDEVRTAYVTFDVQENAMTRDEILDSSVDSVINTKLILQDAKNKGIIASSEEVDLAMANFAQRNGITINELSDSLVNIGSNLEEFKDKIEQDIILNKALTQALAGTDATEEDVANFYQENIMKFMVPEYVVVRQIYLSSKRTNEELVELANKVVTELQEKDFCEVAMKYSDDKNCELYTIGKGTVYQEYEDAAFGQDIGQVSAVQFSGGMHFIQTVQKLNYNPIPLTEIGQTLTEGITVTKRDLEFRKYIKELRDNAEIISYLQK